MRHTPGLVVFLTIALLGQLFGQSSAHFLLNSPPTIGFDDSLEATPPCGSFTVDFSKDNVTNFHVGGDFIAMTSIHPMATWLFRATLDQTASGNWTDLLPAVVQTGLGNYCETGITVPSTWAGSKGVIGIVQDAPDGILYQVIDLILSIFNPFANGDLEVFDCQLRCWLNYTFWSLQECDWTVCRVHCKNLSSPYSVLGHAVRVSTLETQIKTLMSCVERNC